MEAWHRDAAERHDPRGFVHWITRAHGGRALLEELRRRHGAALVDRGVADGWVEVRHPTVGEVVSGACG